MTALLDTCAVLWAKLNPENLSHEARRCIADDSNTLLVSAVTAYEIANKVWQGALPEAEDLERSFMARIDEAGFTFLDLSPAIALRAGRLIGQHRDPWDRMIAAHALALDIPVVSIDAELDAFGVHRIW